VPILKSTLDQTETILTSVRAKGGGGIFQGSRVEKNVNSNERALRRAKRGFRRRGEDSLSFSVKASTTGFYKKFADMTKQERAAHIRQLYKTLAEPV